MGRTATRKTPTSLSVSGASPDHTKVPLRIQRTRSAHFIVCLCAVSLTNSLSIAGFRLSATAAVLSRAIFISLSDVSAAPLRVSTKPERAIIIFPQTILFLV